MYVGSSQGARLRLELLLSHMEAMEPGGTPDRQLHPGHRLVVHCFCIVHPHF